MAIVNTVDELISELIKYPLDAPLRVSVDIIFLDGSLAESKLTKISEVKHVTSEHGQTVELELL